MLKKRGSLIQSILLAMLLIPGLVTAQGSGEVDEIIITTIDPSEFPQVTVFARVLDEAGLPVLDLTETQLQVWELGEEMELDEISEVNGPVRAHIVIDPGLRMGQSRDRLNATQESIRLLVENHLNMSGDDQVAVSIIDRRSIGENREFTEDPQYILSLIDQFDPTYCEANPPDCYSYPGDPLNDILENLVEIQQQEEDVQPGFIIFFTSGLSDLSEVGRLNEVANDARRSGIPIFTVLVNVPGGEGEEAIRELGTNSGGHFLDFDDFENTSTVNEFFEMILSEIRPLYQMTYRSPFNDEARTIEVVHEASGTSGEGRYAVKGIEEPQVSIENISSRDVLSEETIPESIIGKVAFPDSYDRFLESASLLVNREVVNERTNLLNPNNIQFPFPDEILDLNEPEEVEISIVVIDELGLTSTNPSGTVLVQWQPPNQPAPPPTAPPATTTPSPPPTDPPEEGNQDPPPAPNFFLVLMITLLAIAMIGMVITRDRGPVKGLRQTVSQQVDRLTKRISRPSEPLAYLIVLEGDVNIGKSLEIYGTTTMGRSRADSELLFQQHLQADSAISRRHCTIIDEETYFQIRDEDSANGTYLNGVRLESMIARELQDGDEIELARVERGGVKLQFQDLRNEGNFGTGTEIVPRPANVKPGDRF